MKSPNYEDNNYKAHPSDDTKIRNVKHLLTQQNSRYIMMMMMIIGFTFFLTLVLLNQPFANSVDPDQLAIEETNSSESALFVIQCVNLY